MYRRGEPGGPEDFPSPEFRALRLDSVLRFEIESSARSGDRLADLLHNRLPLTKEIQLNLWLETCLQMAPRSGGRLRTGMDDPSAALRDQLAR